MPVLVILVLMIKRALFQGKNYQLKKSKKARIEIIAEDLLN